jgi:hypothetical protein
MAPPFCEQPVTDATAWPGAATLAHHTAAANTSANPNARRFLGAGFIMLRKLARFLSNVNPL